MFVFHISGGPLVTYLEEEKRSVLIGSIHGAFEACSNDLPGLYVQSDDLAILGFIQQEVFGQGIHSFYYHAYAGVLKLNGFGNRNFNIMSHLQI